MIPVLGSQPAGEVSHKPSGKPAVTPEKPLRRLLPLLLLVNSLPKKTITRQRRDCDLNLGPSGLSPAR